MAHETCDWIGASGTKYTYYVYPRHPQVDAGKMGNYIYAKKNAEGRWMPIYMGEGDLSVRCTKSHHQQECINSKGATHVHMRLNATETARDAEETDLLARYLNSYGPSG